MATVKTERARLSLSSIGLPSTYVRLRENNERINMFVEQIRDNAEQMKKTMPDAPDVERMMKAYHLPPIHVFKMKAPVNIEYSNKETRKKETRTVGYEVVDGVHRVRINGLLGLDSIDCIVHEYLTPAQSFAMQYKLNNEGPLPFNRDTRDAAIQRFATFKEDGKFVYTKAQIGIMTLLSEAQVSRIISGKSRTQTAEQVSEKMKRKGKGKGKGKNGVGKFTESEFFAKVGELAKVCAAKADELKAYMDRTTRAWEYSETLIEGLAFLRGKEVTLTNVKK